MCRPRESKLPRPGVLLHCLTSQTYSLEATSFCQRYLGRRLPTSSPFSLRSTCCEKSTREHTPILNISNPQSSFPSSNIIELDPSPTGKTYRNHGPPHTPTQTPSRTEAEVRGLIYNPLTARWVLAPRGAWGSTDCNYIFWVRKPDELAHLSMLSGEKIPVVSQ